MTAGKQERLQSRNTEPGALAQLTQKYGWAMLIAWLFCVLGLTHYLPRLFQSVNLNIYLVQPLLWTSVGVAVLYLENTKPGKIWATTDRWLIGVAAFAGLFQISASILSGLLMGFGHSPYSHKIQFIALNAWFVASRLAGFELARWHMLNQLKRRGQLLSIVLTWLVFTFASLPITRLGSIQIANVEGVFRLIGNDILPAASTNALATYLVLIGGPFASMAYLGILAAFEWLSPILPNVGWTMATFVGTVVPILALLFIHDLLDWRETHTNEAAPKGSSVWTGWILASVVVVFFLWFNSGLFGVRPTLVSGISMEPAIKPGDIVITREVTASQVKQGDVVLFSDGKRSILHRVVDIRMENGSLIFYTQGDNVTQPDDPWSADQLKGKLVTVIPKLGWISFGMKMLFNRISFMGAG